MDREGFKGGMRRYLRSVGHAQPNVTLPLGAQVELDADRRQLTILENPVTIHES